jgi:PAS domain S-box-containing protein
MPNSDELLALLMDNVTEYALIILDPDGAVALWNAGAERLLGYEEHEILGVHFAVFFTPEDTAAGMPERELQTARTHGRATDDNWLVRKDGSRLWASGMTMPLWDAQQRLRGFTKIVWTCSHDMSHIWEAILPQPLPTRRAPQTLRPLLDKTYSRRV